MNEQSSYNPICKWTYNCGPRDFDFGADWGTLTIQRNSLLFIRLTLYFWNELDGWKTKTKIKTPPNAPTSEPYTFHGFLYHSWCKGVEGCAEKYFGLQYKFTCLMEIIYGGNSQQIVIDEYFFDSDTISNNLKFCKKDPLYNEFDSSCTDELPDC